MCVKYTYLPPDLKEVSLLSALLLCLSDWQGDGNTEDYTYDDSGVWL